jgi:hypothetical protein
MIYRRVLMSLSLSLVLGLSACDPGTLVLPILTISMTWGVDGDADRSFSFSSEDDGKISGNVEGSENRGGESAPLSGYWVEGRLTFTVQWPGGAVTYRADFEEDNPTSLIIVSNQETLTITQG